MAELSFSLVFVPAKKFYFGVDDGEIASCDKPFLIAKTEVTSRLWRSVCDWAVKEGEYSFSNSGLKGSHGKGSEDQPVTTSNCTDIAVFGNSLTEGVNTRSGSNLSCAHRKGDRPFRDFTLREAGEALKLISIAPGATGFCLPWAREWEPAASFIADLNSDGDILDKGAYYPRNYLSGTSALFTDELASRLVAVFTATPPPQLKAASAQP